jgi:Domain of unknown function (DUF4232)
MIQPIRVLRHALLASTLAIVALACNSTTATAPPAVTPPTTTPPTAAAPTAAAPTSPSPAASGGACSLADLAVTAGGWGAAAGSRGADVSVENRGTAACELPAGPAVAILDAAGTQLLASPPSDQPGPTLEPGGVATFTVLFSNWCEEGAALPLRVALIDGAAGIPVPELDMTAADLPPCNGPGQPPALSANPWEPVSG